MFDPCRDQIHRAAGEGEPGNCRIDAGTIVRSVYRSFGPAIEGHRIGDQFLQRLGEVLRNALRKEDMLVRFGGEEFLVLLPDVPGPGAVVVAGRLRKAVASEAIVLGELSLTATVSAGVAARLDEGPESVDTLVARAEEALALAKRRGRNRVVALSLGRSIAA